VNSVGQGRRTWLSTDEIIHFRRFSQYLRRFLADVILKMKLKKIASITDEIRYVFVGRLRPLKVTSFPPLRRRPPLNDGNFIFASDVHITADENNFLNSMKSMSQHMYKADVNTLVTTTASWPTDDISYLNSMNSASRRNC
jgi:hypothetical protein